MSFQELKPVAFGLQMTLVNWVSLQRRRAHTHQSWDSQNYVLAGAPARRYFWDLHQHGIAHDLELRCSDLRLDQSRQ